MDDKLCLFKAFLEAAQSNSPTKANDIASFVKEKHNTDLFNLLLDFEDEWKPLHLACQLRDPVLIEFLVKHGADVTNQTKKHRLTPLHIIANNGCEQSTKILLRAGAPIQMKDVNDLTPLHYAASQGYRAVVEAIMKEMKQQELLDYAPIDRDGNTPLLIAKKAQNQKVVESMQLMLSRYMPKSLVDHDEITQLNEFLTETAKLPQYLPGFISNGYTRLEYWSKHGISNADYETIGVSLPGHRRIINSCLESFGNDSEEESSEESSTDEDSDASDTTNSSY